MKNLMLWVTALLVYILIPLTRLYTPKTSAESAWLSGATITEEPRPNGLVNGGNLECEYFSLKSQYISQYTLQNGRVGYTDSTVETPGASYPDICMAQNDYGLVGSGFWAKDGNVNETLPVDAGPYSMLPAPGGNTTLFMTPAPTFGTQYSINHNLPYIGYLGAKLLGSGVSQKSEKIWRIDTSKMDEFLTYSDGQVVRIDQVGFSSNGRYLVAQLSRRGVVLIDLYTKKMIPFSVNSFNTGANMFMNVSNDGRFAAVYSPSGLAIYDLTGCATSYDYGVWPSGGALATSGCASREYFADLRAAYPLLTNINRLRFSPNGSSLNVDVSWRDSSGEIVAKRLRLSANGFVSTAKGYLAMGDSYSSGEGDTEGGTWYEPGTDEQGNIDTFAGRNLCHLSRRSYPYLMAVQLGYLSNNATTPPADGMFHSVACSGAKIHNIIGSVGEKQDDGNGNDFAITDNQYRYDRLQPEAVYLPGTSKQLDWLNSKILPDNSNRPPQNPEVITIGVGGNDGGFADFIAACVAPGTCELAQPSNKKSVDSVVRIAENRNRLVETYKKIKASAPDARIYVHGYPKIIEGVGGYCAANVRLDDQERLYIEKVTQYMNEVVKSAAREAGVIYVDVEDIFDRQKLCSGADAENILMNGVTAGNDVRLPEDSTVLAMLGIHGGICLRACIGRESYHPKSGGFVKYKDAILSQTNNLTTSMPAAISEEVPVPDVFFGSDAINQVMDLNGRNGFPAKEQTLQEDLITGFQFSSKTISLNLHALAPNSSLEVIVESTPISLGKFTSNANGGFGANLTLPAGLEPGYHEIHIIAKDNTGKSIDYYQPLILGAYENDFDGDGALDSVDSCTATQNSGIDIDLDRVDDACDESPVAPAVPPQAPGTPDLADASDSGISQTDNITNDISPTFTISCLDTNVVTIYSATTVLGSASCVNNIATITNADLGEGQYGITARQADQKGLSSEASAALDITIDSKPPAVPAQPDLSTTSDTGVSNTDNITSDTTPTINGRCTADDSVKLFVDGQLSVVGICSNGQYALDLSILTQGQHLIAASFTDSAGNTSVLSTALQITLGPDAVKTDDEDKGCRDAHSEKAGKPKNQNAPPVCTVTNISEVLSGKEDDKRDKVLVVADVKPMKQFLVVVDAPKTGNVKVK